MDDRFSLASIQGMVCKNYPGWEKDIKIQYLERRLVQVVQQLMRQEMMADNQRCLLKNIIHENEASIIDIHKKNSRLKELQKELETAKSNLEAKIAQATSKLEKKNTELQKKTRRLQESNIALDVLLRKKDKDTKAQLKLSMEKLRNDIFADLVELAGLANTEKQKILILRIMNNIQRDTPEQINQNWNANLSAREAAVAGLIAEGKTHAETADILQVSIRTIDAHCYKIRRKLNVPEASRLRDFLCQIM